MARAVTAEHGSGDSEESDPVGLTPLVRVAAIDDDRLLLDGLASCFSALPSIALVAVATTVDELLHTEVTFDVVLLDLQLKDASDPVGNVARLTALGYAVLVVSSHTDCDRVIAATSAGAHGYVTKDHDVENLVDALREVAEGKDVYSPELAHCWARDTRSGRPDFSVQEMRILVFYSDGCTLAQAARMAGVQQARPRSIWTE
jgi:two-component system nitrate/nitrite response regulator NarL